MHLKGKLHSCVHLTLLELVVMFVGRPFSRSVCVCVFLSKRCFNSTSSCLTVDVSDYFVLPHSCRCQSVDHTCTAIRSMRHHKHVGPDQTGLSHTTSLSCYLILKISCRFSLDEVSREVSEHSPHTSHRRIVTDVCTRLSCE